MITVACVMWGKKFPQKYVHNLKKAVEENTTVPHKFVCLSDKTIPGVETKLLKPGFEGWWNKLQLFDKRTGLSGRVVYLDLDTIITGNIDWLLNYDGIFMGIEDLGSVNRHQQHLKGVMQSGVLAFDIDKYDLLWAEFLLSQQSTVAMFRGDGEYLNSVVRKRNLLQHLFPGKLKSYKYEVYPDNIGDASIICFHGRPNIEEAFTETTELSWALFKPQHWIKKYWS